MKATAAFVLIALTCLSPTAIAQDKTLRLEAGKTSPPATLADAAWLAGHWRGQAFGGEIEENWSPPLGDSMAGSFKLVSDGKVQFYELEIIREVEGTLLMQLKHFHGDLKGWEAKDQTVDFPLVKKTEDALYFDGFTIERVGDNEMNMYVLIEEGCVLQETLFAYKRVR